MSDKNEDLKAFEHWEKYDGEPAGLVHIQTEGGAAYLRFNELMDRDGQAIAEELARSARLSYQRARATRPWWRKLLRMEAKGWEGYQE